MTPRGEVQSSLPGHPEPREGSSEAQKELAPKRENASMRLSARSFTLPLARSG